MPDFLFGNVCVEVTVGRIGLRIRDVVPLRPGAAALRLLLPIVRRCSRLHESRDVRNVHRFYHVQSYRPAAVGTLGLF
jgi:hypothetical protein